MVGMDDKTTDDLFLDLGRALEGLEPPAVGSRPGDSDDLIKKAKRWYLSQKSKLQKLLCHNEKLKNLVTDEPTAKVRIVAIIIDAISAPYAYLPCGTLAEIIFREGLMNLCGPDWQESE